MTPTDEDDTVGELVEEFADGTDELFLIPQEAALTCAIILLKIMNGVDGDTHWLEIEEPMLTEMRVVCAYIDDCQRSNQCIQ